MGLEIREPVKTPDSSDGEICNRMADSIKVLREIASIAIAGLGVVALFEATTAESVGRATILTIVGLCFTVYSYQISTRDWTGK